MLTVSKKKKGMLISNLHKTEFKQTILLVKLFCLTTHQGMFLATSPSLQCKANS